MTDQGQGKAVITLPQLTGPQLAQLRKAKGMNQTQLARAAGCGRHTVSYWETKAAPFYRGWAVDRFGEVLGFRLCRIYSPNTRTRGDGLLVLPDPQQEALDREFERRWAAMQERIAHAAARKRVRCNARTRKGHPCKLKSEPGRKRCKFHGGKSTGPKTPEGRARIAEYQRQRWAKWRADRETDHPAP